MDRRLFVKIFTGAVTASVAPIPDLGIKFDDPEEFHLGVDFVIPNDPESLKNFQKWYIDPAIKCLRNTLASKLRGRSCQFSKPPIPSGVERAYVGGIGDLPMVRYVQFYDVYKDRMLGRYDLICRTV